MAPASTRARLAQRLFRDSKLEDTTLLDSYIEEPGGPAIKYDGKKDEKNDNSTKGELVIETTLASVKKFHVIPPAMGADI